jgi:hypothetical protein
VCDDANRRAGFLGQIRQRREDFPHVGIFMRIDAGEERAHRIERDQAEVGHLRGAPGQNIEVLRQGE